MVQLAVLAELTRLCRAGRRTQCQDDDWSDPPSQEPSHDHCRALKVFALTVVSAVCLRE
jgi:hypothetical protein